jgi:glucose/arabinose dehydrogenase
VLAIAWLGLQAPASAAQLQPIGSFTNPVFVTSDPSDAERLFVVEQGGRIELTVGGTTTTFLDATGLSSPGIASGGEQGLLSMAFATDYATSGRFYVFYTGTDAGALHVDQFMASGDTASAGTRKEVITVPHPSFNNHNAGQLQVGPDGYLYVSTGDGGSGGDPGENAQNPSSLLGKVLRIAPDSDGGYDTPQDNPFGNEVWSYGLRNPFRFSFDRLTGDLLIGDVGQAAWEEVDFDPVAAGAGRGDNFGWDCYEGRHVFELTLDCPAIGATTQPILEYPNPNGGANPSSAVNGGYVVRDPSVCELYGRYVYADTYAGQLRSLVPALPDAIDDRSEGIAVPFTTSFGEDAAGRVYVASNGSVYRIVHTPGTDCPTPPSSDTSPPALTLIAKLRQSIGDRRVDVTARVDEQAIAAVSATVTKGKADKPLFDLPDLTATVQPGEDEQLDFELKRGQARKLRRLLRRARHLDVRFRGSAIDAAGNQGAGAEVSARLRR